jgi:hypothetical protein
MRYLLSADAEPVYDRRIWELRLKYTESGRPGWRVGVQVALALGVGASSHKVWFGTLSKIERL